ncbi:hypothetical protein TYRP_022698 [Tyrophagus putrescentiae]|nr:hypothetical protein TYRP_022698 [Tyrophagus putrescentiae]
MVSVSKSKLLPVAVAPKSGKKDADDIMRSLKVHRPGRLQVRVFSRKVKGAYRRHAGLRLNRVCNFEHCFLFICWALLGAFEEGTEIVGHRCDGVADVAGKALSEALEDDIVGKGTAGGGHQPSKERAGQLRMGEANVVENRLDPLIG